MYRRELLILLTLAVISASLVATGTALFVKRLNTAVDAVADITVPDFVSTGELLQRLTNNWNSVLTIQICPSVDERRELIQQIEANSIEPFLADFQKTPSDSRQQIYFDKLVEERMKYLKLRQHYFEMAEANQMVEAGLFLNATLRPAFTKYREQAYQLFRATAHLGRLRARHVASVSREAIIVSAGLTVVMFFSGILIGFKTIFEGLAFANRIGKLISSKK